MQIDYPRWLPAAVTKNRINTKMMISQEPLVEIDPTLCHNVSCSRGFGFFFFVICIPRWPPFAFAKNSADHDNDNISITTQ